MDRRNYIGYQVDISNGDFTDVGTKKGIITLGETSLYPNALRGYVAPTGIANNYLLYAPLNGTNDGWSGNGSGQETPVFANVMYGVGNAVFSNAQLKMDGSTYSGYSPAEDSSAFVSNTTVTTNISTGNGSTWSIQFWWYNGNAQNGTYRRLVSIGGSADTGSGIEAEVNNTNLSSYVFYEYSADGVGNRTNRLVATMATGAWHHVYWAINPSGNTYIGINGTVTTYSNYLTNGISPNSTNLTLGGFESGGGISAYFQEVIVRNDIPYTSNFTPNTAPLVAY